MFWISVLFFLFKQKTAYEMRISDWSSDVGSSDLRIESPCPRVLALLLKPIEGDTCDNCSRLLTRLSDSSDDDSTETETGTFCKFCSRFCAVTTISSLAASSTEAGAACAGRSSWAWAPAGTAIAVATLVSKNARQR